MITAIKAENVGAYKALFEEASDILSGYKRVRTYDSDVATYYYKNAEAETADELFKPETSIVDLVTFAAALADYSVLYVKALDEDGNEIGAAEGFEPMLGITTLEEYFSWLRNLGSINRKYTVLPLDEDHFIINADTRAITIPPSFKKNGIAVQGDDLAEVLYFKVDRYFDYMDLNNADIYIQWETPKDPVTGLTTKSVSAAYIRDIESEPGKLIFGWAISDAITAISGNLKFSVRFFQWEDEDKATTGGEKILAYSLSTLTASVAIQSSIGFNPEKDEYVVDDCGNRLIERLENSEIAGGYAAAIPIFIKDLDDPNKDCIYDLNEETNLFDMFVQAYSTDTGAITYVWKKQGLNEDNTADGQDITSFSGANAFIKVEDLTNLSKAYHYYQTNGTDADGNPIYTKYTGTIPPSAEDLADEDFALYVKQSKFTADSVGVYWVVAENRITNSTSAQLSHKAIFPRPEDVVVSINPTAKAILLDEDTDGDYEVTLSAGASNTDGVLTYQWEMDPNYTLNFGDKEPAFVEIEGATNSTYVATQPGHYRAIITNTRNLAHKYATTEKSRVTYTAKTPVILEEDLNAKIFQVSSLSDDNCPTIRLDQTVESDGYTVSWYLSEGTYYAPIVENAEIALGTYSASFNPKNYEDKIKELSTENPDIDGAYFAIVTNHVNGSTKATEKPEYSDMFKVTY